MASEKYWTVGLILVIVWLVLNQLVGFIGVEFGIADNAQLILLLIPALASFLVTVGSTKGSVARALMLLLPIATLGPLFHLIGGELGGKTDFPGVAALPSTITIFLMEGSAVVLPGILVGLLWKKYWRSPQRDET
jgi:hypothetical protein